MSLSGGAKALTSRHGMKRTPPKPEGYAYWSRGREGGKSFIICIVTADICSDNEPIDSDTGNDTLVTPHVQYHPDFVSHTVTP